ncbi:hypothetical protein [Escherichia coli]|uniref:hypothetical protein n=1 Tax=Escherichia coli TaxID=562 RepID=UPI002FCCD14F
MALPLGIIGFTCAMRWKKLRRSSSMSINWNRATAKVCRMAEISFKEIATKHWRSLLTCIGLVIATNVTYYMLLTYMPSYLSHNLHYSEDHGC